MLGKEDKRLRKMFLKCIGGGFIPNESLRTLAGDVKYGENYSIDSKNKVVNVDVYNGEITGDIRDMPPNIQIMGENYLIRYNLGNKKEQKIVDLNTSEGLENIK